MSEKIKILVLCTGNSCRSIMFEALLNHFASNIILAKSAGSFPAGSVNPLTIKTLQNHQIPTENLRSKSWDEFKDEYFDIVITVCDNAANESCPLFLGKSIKVHLGVSDPAESKSEAEYERVFAIIKKRVLAIKNLDFSLPKEKLILEFNNIASLN